MTVAYWYLATVYSKHPEGQEEAYRMACRAAGALMNAGVPTYSPIAHGHGLSVHGGIDPLDHDIWVRNDKPMVDAAPGMIVYRSSGWEQSRGITHEIAEFTKAGKRILYMDTDNAIPEGAL